MKVVAVDFGTRRLGLAIGEGGRFLFGRTLEITEENEAINKLVSLAKNEAISSFVIGLPVRLNGTERQEAKHVREFSARLSKRTNLPVVFVDERLSTVEAMDLLKDEGRSEEEIGEMVDQKVAELLLEQYYRNQR